MSKSTEQEKSFKLIIDHHPFEWPEPYITGFQIKKLAGVDPSYGVWQELPGPNDPPVEDNQQVDLQEPGRERFFTGIKKTTEGSYESIA